MRDRLYLASACFSISDMLGWHTLSGRHTLTPFSLGVLVLCVVPFLLDVVFCDEVNATTLHQPALVDGEEADPFKATADFTSPDLPFPTRIHLPGTSDDRETVAASEPLRPPTWCGIVSLASRPPPTC